MKIKIDKNLITAARRLAEDMNPGTQDRVNDLAMIYQGYIEMINGTGWIKTACDARRQLQAFVAAAKRQGGRPDA